jgi:dUTP pyrophosphatase
MFLPGSEVAKVMDKIDGKQVQPAGVDITAVEVFRLDGPGEIDFSNERRRIPEGTRVDFEDKIHLEAGSYRITYGETVAIPEDAAGIVLPRSSLMRMGATVISALWDPGYRGRGQGLLVVFNKHGMVLHKGARIAQLFLVRGESSGKYSGKFQGENL